ncbi:MAG: 6-bladed beta-propeller [Haliscomenobacter sp.]|nr:6-bladed beta-propeller [Haliscomenobacter sp.]
MNQPINTLLKKTAMLALGAIMLGACKKEAIQSGSPAFTETEIVIPNDDISPSAAVDVIAEALEAVPLETPKEAYVSDWADKVVTTSDNRIVLVNNHNVAIFNALTGKFIKELQPAGDGPGEYSSFREVSYNPFTNEIELFADFQRKELIYDSDGNYLRDEDQYLLYGSKMYLTKDLCAYSCNQNNSELLGTKESYKIVLHDKKKNRLTGYLPLPHFEEKLSNLKIPYPFSSTAAGLSWFQPFNNGIFSVTPDGVSNRYSIVFRKNNIPSDFWEKNRKYTGKLEAGINENFPFLDSYFFENSQFIISRYMQNNIIQFVVYDKHKKRCVINTKSIFADKWGLHMPLPRHINKTGFLFILAAEDFIAMMESFDDKSLLPKSFLKAYRQAKPIDNPILITLTVKGGEAIQDVVHKTNPN